MRLRIAAVVGLHIAAAVALALFVKWHGSLEWRLYVPLVALMAAQVCAMGVWLALGNTTILMRAGLASLGVIGLWQLLNLSGDFDEFGLLFSFLEAAVVIPIWVGRCFGLALRRTATEHAKPAIQFTLFQGLAAISVLGIALSLARWIPSPLENAAEIVALLAATTWGVSWAMFRLARPWAALPVVLVLLCFKLLIEAVQGTLDTANAILFASLFGVFGIVLATTFEVFRLSGYRLAWRRQPAG